MKSKLRSFIILLVSIFVIGLPQNIFAEEIDSGIHDVEDSVNSLEVKEVKKYYHSLNGEKIEYSKENEEFIKKQKQKDLETYNSLNPTEQMKIEDLGGNLTPEFNIENNGKGTNIEVKEKDLKVTPFNLGPPTGGSSGNMSIQQGVTYRGKVGSNHEYLYATSVEWNGSPSVFFTDHLAAAWDERAVPTPGSFNASYFGYSEGIGEMPPTVSQGPLEADRIAVYGNSVKKVIESYAYQNIVMNRVVRVNDDYDGHPSLIVAEYYHPYIIGDVSLSWGPASVTFSGPWGDSVLAEYGFNYGDQ